MRTAILVILDGFGINPDPRHNAVAMAKTPVLNRVRETYSETELDASEGNVGLPRGFMGNSEVGHLNIGAGRVVYQDFSLISQAIEEGSFYHNEALGGVMGELAKKGKGTLHLMGLVSDGGVHSHISHLFALIQHAKKLGIKKVAVHAFTDGRDTSPTSGVGFIAKLKGFLADSGVGEIASVTGRFYAMDRDSRWERTEKAFEAIVSGRCEKNFSDPVACVEESYRQGQTDEFILPTISKRYAGISDGDGVIFFNFRADRARQITRAITQKDFPSFRRDRFPTLVGFVTMTPYDATLPLPSAFEKPKVPNTLGELVSREGWKQLRIAETEKYAHVTYFFNGGVEAPFSGEKRILIPSPREIKTYDLKPEMSAPEVTAQLLEALKQDTYGLVVVNFANCDMVGHTGNLRAAIRAVETVDSCLGKIVDWVESHEAVAIITADHGNCEKMLDDAGAPLTSHTLLRVPLILVDPKRPKSKLAAAGRLCDIAPTLCSLLKLNKPKEMTGSNLIDA